MLPLSSRVTWTTIAAAALLPAAATAGISLSERLGTRNTTVSDASANTRGAAIMQNKKTAHSFFMDFLRVKGVRSGRSLAGAGWNCTHFGLHSPPRKGGSPKGRSLKGRCASIEVRPKRFVELTTPSATSLRSAHPPLCEEGIRLTLDRTTI